MAAGNVYLALGLMVVMIAPLELGIDILYGDTS